MGTRSRVGIMHGTVCKSVYCHYDGYLDYTGRILLGLDGDFIIVGVVVPGACDALLGVYIK